MADNTAIEWVDDISATGRRLGAQKSAARKAGCSLEEWRAHRAHGQRWCYRCRDWGSTQNFSKDCTRAGGYAPICKPCNSTRATRSRYGLTEEEFKQLVAAGACPICGRTDVAMEVDHNHATGKVRAILCSRCNNGLGAFCDDPHLMRRAALYLEFHDHG